MNKHDSGSNDDGRVTLKYNVCYIVAAVIIKDGTILMIQEAKRSCRGLWYLPAGRLEPGETLYEGVEREVEEETGLKFRPEALTLVEADGLSWFRFTFTGTIIGGELKSLENSDKESLQAAWLDYDTVMQGRSDKWPLRASDIRICVKATEDCISRGLSDWAFLPVCNDQCHMDIRLLVRNEHSKKVLAAKSGTVIPSFRLKTKFGNRTLMFALNHFVMKSLDIKSADLTKTVLYFVLDLEHSGKLEKNGSYDGFMMTALAEISVDIPETCSGCDYSWTSIDDISCLKTELKEKMRHKAAGAVLVLKH